MIRRYPNFLFLLLIAILAGCSVPTQVEPTSEIQTISSDKLSTPESNVTSPRPTQAASSGSALTPAPEAGQDRLEGIFYFIGYEGSVPTVFTLDLVSGQERSIFKAPANAWLTELAISPNGDQILLAYSPPPEEGQPQYGFTDLYIMPADGAANPELLLQDPDPSDTFFNISWPLADTIYYAHFLPTIDADGNITYGSQVERHHLPDASTEIITTKAAWPRAADDGTLLAYVTDANDLILANGDGSEPRTLLESDTFAAVDAPVFSPDKSLLCFSAVDNNQALTPSRLSRLLGLRVAAAHSTPSDWWCMNLDGESRPNRLTELDAIGFYGDFSPGGDYLAFMTVTGLYTMRPDGSELRQRQERPLTGTLNWAP